MALDPWQLGLTNGIRTHVSGVKARRPNALNDSQTKTHLTKPENIALSDDLRDLYVISVSTDLSQ